MREKCASSESVFLENSKASCTKIYLQNNAVYKTTKVYIVECSELYLKKIYIN